MIACMPDVDESNLNLRRFEVGNAANAALVKYHTTVTRGAFGRGMTVDDFTAVPELAEMIESVKMYTYIGG